MRIQGEMVSQKKFNDRCHWWSKDAPDRKVVGSVGFDGTDITCEVDDDLVPFGESTEVLHATTNTGIKITAFDVFVRSKSAFRVLNDGSRSCSTCRLMINTRLVGEHVDGLSSQLYQSAKFRIEGLDEWMPTGSIQSEQPKPQQDLHVRCSPPTQIPISVPGKECTVVFDQARCPTHEPLRVSFSLEYRSHIKIVPDRPQLHGWFMQIGESVRSMLTLLIDKNVELEEMSLDCDPPIDETVHQFWRPRSSPSEETCRTSVLLPENILHADLATILTSWISCHEREKYPRSLLMDSMRGRSQLMETRFIGIMQGLEAFDEEHATKFLEKAVYREKTLGLIQQIPDEFAPELRDKIKQSILHSNTQSLREKILGLLDRIGPELELFVCKDRQLFAKTLKDSRNGYTHYGGSTAKCLKNFELYWATEQARLLLKTVFLRECGVSGELLARRYGQTSRLTQGRDIWHGIETRLSANSSLT